MSELEKAARQALEALELEDMACRYEKDPTPEHIAKAIAALRSALEQPAQIDPSAGTQVSKVWWDGDKLMAQPIPLESIYKEPEQPAQQEPVARVVGYYAGRCVIEPLDPAAVMPNNMALYTRPQAREPLTDEQIHDIYDEVARREPYNMAVTRRNIARAIEAAHGIGEKR